MVTETSRRVDERAAKAGRTVSRYIDVVLDRVVSHNSRCTELRFPILIAAAIPIKTERNAIPYRLRLSLVEKGTTGLIRPIAFIDSLINGDRRRARGVIADLYPRVAHMRAAEITAVVRDVPHRCGSCPALSD